MSGLYVDSSALLKRLFREKESSLVRALLAERTEQAALVASSDLAWVEVARAVRRAGVTDVDSAVAKACSGIARQRLDSVVLDRAWTIALRPCGRWTPSISRRRSFSEPPRS